MRSMQHTPLGYPPVGENLDMGLFITNTDLTVYPYDFGHVIREAEFFFPDYVTFDHL